jgi:hypothetical protein
MKLEDYEKELVIDLLREHAKGLRKGEIVGGDFTADEVDEIASKVTVL